MNQATTTLTRAGIDLADRQAIQDAFKTHQPQRVVNLAAQAGVRYSIDNPLAYIDSNIVGFAHILEGCRHNGVEHLVYASSSSVYGADAGVDFAGGGFVAGQGGCGAALVR